MDLITYEEYEEKHKKMTKVERAFYETYYNYNTMLRTKEALAEIAKLKEEMVAIKERILAEARAEKI